MNAKEQLHEAITELQAATKRGELPRPKRLAAIEELTEGYFARTGEMPDGVALERLADLALYEELTDDNVHKVAHNEYPIMSETQLARRREGRHVKKEAQRKEVSFEGAATVGVDGKNHRLPLRNRNEALSNNKTKSRNKDRLKKYNDFTTGKSDGLFSVNIATGERLYEGQETP